MAKLREAVADDIRDQIATGQLTPGMALPSTRAIASTHRVSVFTVNEAMRELTAEGLILSVERSRRIVAGPAKDHLAARAPAQRSPLRAADAHLDHRLEHLEALMTKNLDLLQELLDLVRDATGQGIGHIGLSPQPVDWDELD